jgi:hypothetical protein
MSEQTIPIPREPPSSWARWRAKLRLPRGSQGRIKLRYFDEILPVELAAINRRRRHLDERRREEHRHGSIKENHPKPPRSERLARDGEPHGRFDAASQTDKPRLYRFEIDRPEQAGPPPPANPVDPEYERTRPRPLPNTTRGLSFSGGGIRSAALCLGTLQALHKYRIVDSLDYLSTVSGGGYAGSCLSAAMSTQATQPQFPFGDDIFDSDAVAHLRNYSNYLLPRGRSSVRNLAEAAAILLRGILTNTLLVMMALLGCVLVTYLAYPTSTSLTAGSFVPRLIDRLIGSSLAQAVGPWPFSLAIQTVLLTAALLLCWSLLRSLPGRHRYADDADSPYVRLARIATVATVVITFLDLQPLAIAVVKQSLVGGIEPWLKRVAASLVAFSGAISVMASQLGKFLKTTEHDEKTKTLLLRNITQIAVFIAALVLPVALWGLYLWLSSIQLDGSTVSIPILGAVQAVQAYAQLFFLLFIFTWIVGPNAYSLHRFYRDRLSRAFLFDPGRLPGAEPAPLDHVRLSELSDHGPYHIINTAMNVQGSREANKRGRNADFFMFSRYFIGSDLTLYASLAPVVADTPAMEQVDPMLDLGTAMAISGAAVSANMGGSTVRLLSPTLALLNIRLGYWLRNPRDVARRFSVGQFLRNLFGSIFQRLYLLREMLNLLDEKSSHLLLTDGGHIENLGIYELLKRGSQLIIAVDAEADPAMAFPSLMKLERFARIDLGVRIALPWEEIAEITKQAATNFHPGRVRGISENGPHCAVGRIFYENGSEGVLVYFKSSMTGDEKDFIVDYKLRYSDFPHETTGDQFFSEEQFEAYRALSFHAVDGFFSGTDRFAFLGAPLGGWPNPRAAFDEIKTLVGTTVLAGQAG